eukprot:3390797-Rhodomonas_salina.2
MLRAIQKYYFPDSSEASQLWVKLYTFAMVRDRAQKFAAMGSAGKRLAPRVTTPQVVSDALLAGSVELVADALKNVTARNAEEKCHSRHAKFFREKELKQVSPAPVLDSARCRGHRPKSVGWTVSACAGGAAIPPDHVERVVCVGRGAAGPAVHRRQVSTKVSHAFLFLVRNPVSWRRCGAKITRARQNGIRPAPGLRAGGTNQSSGGSEVRQMGRGSQANPGTYLTAMCNLRSRRAGCGICGDAACGCSRTCIASVRRTSIALQSSPRSPSSLQPTTPMHPRWPRCDHDQPSRAAAPLCLPTPWHRATTRIPALHVAQPAGACRRLLSVNHP